MDNFSKLPHELASKITISFLGQDFDTCEKVCDIWKRMIQKPEFIQSYYSMSSAMPSKTLLHHQDTITGAHFISILGQALHNLDSFSPTVFSEMAVVGVHKGIVCIAQLPFGDRVALLNPFLRQSFELPNPIKNIPASIGLGSEGIAIVVVRIFPLSREHLRPERIQVFSTKSLVWEDIENNDIFGTLPPYCDTVVKGSPYWVPIEKPNEKIISFNVDSRKVKTLGFPCKTEYTRLIFELDESLAVFIWSSPNSEIWVYNEKWNKWRCRVTLQLENDIPHIVSCLGQGEIVYEREPGHLVKLQNVQMNATVMEDTIVMENAHFYRCFSFQDGIFPLRGFGEGGDEGKGWIMAVLEGKGWIMAVLVVAAAALALMFIGKYRLKG